MKTDKILLYAIYGAGAYFLIRYAMKFYVKGRDRDVLDIVRQKYEGLDDKFLDAWANGVKSKMTQFPYEGKMYDVITGKVVIK
jgi:hypothetical protein